MDGLTVWMFCISAAVIALTLLYRYLTREYGYWQSQGVLVPSKRVYPIIGSEADFFKKEMFDMDVDRLKKYGKIYGTYFMGSKFINVTDPEIIKLILVKDFHIFVNRLTTKFGVKIFDKAVTFATNDDWKRLRSVISPTFSGGKIRKMVYIIKNSAEKLTQHLLMVTDKGEFKNIKEEVSKFSIQVIGACAFGLQFDSFNNPNHPFITHSKKMFGRGFKAFLLFTLTGALPLCMSYFKEKISDYIGMKFFRDAAIEILEKRRNAPSEKNIDFLQLIIDAKDGKLEPDSKEEVTDAKEEVADAKEEVADAKEEVTDVKEKNTLQKKWTKTLDEDEIVAQCTTFLSAGHDTIASTISFLTYNLATHPDVQEKLLKEVDEMWDKYGDIDYDVLKKMTYLDAIVSETLRLQTLAVRVQRQAKEDYQIPNTNIVIPKSAFVIIPVYALHHDPEYFPDPEKFDPERFVPENKDNIHPYSYMPFGDGPRNCVAMRFALLEVKVCIAYVLRFLKFAPTEAAKKPLKYTMGMGGLQAGILPVVPEKRTTNLLSTN